MSIKHCINMDVEYHKTRPIKIIPLTTIEEIVNAYKFLTNIDLTENV